MIALTFFVSLFLSLAGDAGTQSNDAEIQFLNDVISLYGRDDTVGGGSFGLLYSQANFVKSGEILFNIQVSTPNYT